MVALIGVASSTLVGCASSVSLGPIATLTPRLLPDGAVEVAISGCYDGTVTFITVDRTDTDQTLWEVGRPAQPGVFLHQFTIGQSPERLPVRVPLAAPLPKSIELSVTVFGDEG